MSGIYTTLEPTVGIDPVSLAPPSNSLSAQLVAALQGLDGQSAYALAVELGFEGTEEEWIASLQAEITAEGIEAALGFEPADDADVGAIGTALAAHVGAGDGAHAVAVAGGAAGFLAGSDKTKLDSVASGATANATDAQLRDRSTHTGEQAQSTVTGLVDDLAAKAPKADAVLTGLTSAQAVTLRADLASPYTVPDLSQLTEIAIGAEINGITADEWIKLAEFTLPEDNSDANGVSFFLHIDGSGDQTGSGGAPTAYVGYLSNYAAGPANAYIDWLYGYYDAFWQPIRAYQDVDGDNQPRLTLYMQNTVGFDPLVRITGRLRLDGAGAATATVWTAPSVHTAVDPAPAATEVVIYSKVGAYLGALPNNGDVRFLRVNADGTVSQLTAAQMVSALGVTADVAAAIHAATGKTTPADADELGLVDSAAAFVLKKLTWLNALTALWARFGALIHGGTQKSTPVGADKIALADSASSWATKYTTLTDLFTALGGGGGASNIGRHAEYIDCLEMQPTVVGGCAAHAFVANTTNTRPDIVSLDFDAAVEEYARFRFTMPKSWNEGTLTAKFKWSHAAAATFNAIWGIQAVAISNDDATNAAYGTAVEVTDSGGTTNDEYTTDETSAMTVAGSPAAEDTIEFRVYRKAADGSDTLNVDARLHGIVLYMTTDAATDA